MTSSRSGSPWYRRIFFGVMLIVQLSIIWPGFAFFSAAEPLVLGLPLSFAWLIAMLLLGFAALISLYVMDNRRQDAIEAEKQARNSSSETYMANISGREEEHP